MKSYTYTREGKKWERGERGEDTAAGKGDDSRARGDLDTERG